MQRDQAHRTNELLERIAIALEKNNKKENTLTPTSDNPDPAGYGNEDERCDCGNELEGKDVICESCEDEIHYDYKDEHFPYDNELKEHKYGIKNDSDHDIRSTAAYYEEALSSVRHRDLKTKKDCILDMLQMNLVYMVLDILI